MLVHIGQADVAELAHNAWLKTIEDGVHTYDIFKEGVSKEKVGTKEFASAVLVRVGLKPEFLKAVNYSNAPKRPLTTRPPYIRSSEKKAYVGVDVFIEWQAKTDALVAKLEPLAADGLKLEMLSNRGMKVWPGGMEEIFLVDVFRCRFVMPEEGGQATTHKATLALFNRIVESGLDIVKHEGLYTFDGEPGFSKGQGQ